MPHEANRLESSRREGSSYHDVDCEMPLVSDKTRVVRDEGNS